MVPFMKKDNDAQLKIKEKAQKAWNQKRYIVQLSLLLWNKMVAITFEPGQVIGSHIVLIIRIIKCLCLTQIISHVK